MIAIARLRSAVCAAWLACLAAGCSPLFARFTQTDPAALPAGVADLPIVAVDAGARTDDQRFVIWLSGDGGWGDMERETTALMARQGVPTAGINTLRYFWSRRTPQEATRAVERIERAFSARWGKSRFILVGFSFGADIAPLVAEGLSADVRAQMESAVFLAPSLRASFQVNPQSWLGFGGERDVEQVIAGLTSVPVVCVRGAKDAGAACPKSSRGAMRVVVLPGGHSLQGDWPTIARLVLAPAESR